MSADPHVSVVIPIYNEEANLPELVERVGAALAASARSFELILIDDGSRDDSAAILAELAASRAWLRPLYLIRNYGQSAALQAGFDAARGEIIVTLDGDLQNDPADIPRMMQKLEESGVDMVIGVRVNRQDTWSRKMQSKIGNGVRNWITGDRITDTGCSLKLVKKEAVDRVRLFTGMHRFLPTLVRYAGYRVIEMPVSHRPRRFGQSKYGAMNRAFRGLADCFAVRWMGTRMLRYDVAEEPEAARDASS
jgi:dolichol-phosphate mannosyltransferase